MKNRELISASKVAVSRNLGKHVIAASVDWSDEAAKLVLTYYFDRQPTEEDEELCELALGDLIAEFSEISEAVNECIHLHPGASLSSLERIVYTKNSS